MTKIYVIHHYPCTDGLGAKYAAWKKFGDKAIYIPADYKDPTPEIESGSEVYIADFSYSKEFLRDLYSRSKVLKVLDHHKSAKEILSDEPYATFDMEKSGAVLAWEYFHPGVPTPTLLEFIQDRDLWRWELPDTKAVLSGLSVIPEDMGAWDAISSKEGSSFLKNSGEAISQYKDKEVGRVIPSGNVKLMTYGGSKIALLNTTHLTSEMGNELCKQLDIDYAILWYIDGSGVVRLSFRSEATKSNFDVSNVAKNFNGGGHRNASGGRADIEWLVSML